jgi:hypothetical protein
MTVRKAIVLKLGFVVWPSLGEEGRELLQFLVFLLTFAEL